MVDADLHDVHSWDGGGCDDFSLQEPSLRIPYFEHEAGLDPTCAIDGKVNWKSL